MPDESPLIDRIRTLSRPLLPRPTAVPPKLPRLSGIRAVLLDVYGTMLVSGSGDVGTATAVPSDRAAQAALRDAGFEVLSDAAGARATLLCRERILREREERQCAGTTYPEIEIRDIWAAVLADLVARQQIRGQVTDDTVATVAVAYEVRVNPTWPMPELELTIRGLRKFGLVLAIVSNSQFYTPLLFPAYLNRTVEALGFDLECSSWSYELREGKPSTVLYQRALDRLRARHGLDASQVLYVGNDMLNDIWAASQCGMHTALFAGDARSLRWRENDNRCRTLSPDAVITQLRQLHEILARTAQ